MRPIVQCAMASRPWDAWISAFEQVGSPYVECRRSTTAEGATAKRRRANPAQLDAERCCQLFRHLIALCEVGRTKGSLDTMPCGPQPLTRAAGNKVFSARTPLVRRE